MTTFSTLRLQQKRLDINIPTYSIHTSTPESSPGTNRCRRSASEQSLIRQQSRNTCSIHIVTNRSVKRDSIAGPYLDQGEFFELLFQVHPEGPLGKVGAEQAGGLRPLVEHAQQLLDLRVHILVLHQVRRLEPRSLVLKQPAQLSCTITIFYFFK
jgi:hypothetical protein